MMREVALAERDLEHLDRDDRGRSRGRARDGSVMAICESAPDLEAQVFSLVYRQMHALYGRWRRDFEDLAQAAAEQALRALPSFRQQSELSTWTYKICYRAVLRHRRWYTRWLKVFTLDAPNTGAIVTANAETELQERERLERLARALDDLSEKRRAVIVLRDIEGLGIPAIAAIVGASEATVRSRLRDGRQKLAALLLADPYFGTDVQKEQAT